MKCIYPNALHMQLICIIILLHIYLLLMLYILNVSCVMHMYEILQPMYFIIMYTNNMYYICIHVSNMILCSGKLCHQQVCTS